MKVALYIGDHSADTLTVRLGWWATRQVQKGEFAQVTHVEAILAEYDDGSVTIASASIRDGGVRAKRCHLEPEHWTIIDVPQWDADKAALWFAAHNGEPYDKRGAFASCMPFAWNKNKEWFCNEAVGASVGLSSPEIFGPAQFAVICHTLGELA